MEGTPEQFSLELEPTDPTKPTQIVEQKPTEEELARRREQDRQEDKQDIDETYRRWSK